MTFITTAVPLVATAGASAVCLSSFNQGSLVFETLAGDSAPEATLYARYEPGKPFVGAVVKVDVGEPAQEVTYRLTNALRSEVRVFGQIWGAPVPSIVIDAGYVDLPGGATSSEVRSLARSFELTLRTGSHERLITFQDAGPLRISFPEQARDLVERRVCRAFGPLLDRLEDAGRPKPLR